MFGSFLALQGLPALLLVSVPSAPRAQVTQPDAFPPMQGSLADGGSAGPEKVIPYASTITGALSFRLNGPFFTWVSQQLTTCLGPDVPPYTPPPGSCQVPNPQTGAMEFPFRTLQNELNGTCLINSCIGTNCPQRTGWSWWLPTLDAFVVGYVKDGAPTMSCSGSDPADCVVLYYDTPKVTVAPIAGGTGTFQNMPSACLGPNCQVTVPYCGGMSLGITLANKSWVGGAGHVAGDDSMCFSGGTDTNYAGNCVWFQSLPISVGSQQSGQQVLPECMNGGTDCNQVANCSSSPSCPLSGGAMQCAGGSGTPGCFCTQYDNNQHCTQTGNVVNGGCISGSASCPGAGPQCTYGNGTPSCTSPYCPSVAGQPAATCTGGNIGCGSPTWWSGSSSPYCNGGTPNCSGGTANCSAGAPVCASPTWWAAGSSNAACTGGTPLCLTGTGACATSGGSASCSVGTPGCDAPGWWSSGTSAIACTGTTPVCLTGTGACTTTGGSSSCTVGTPGCDNAGWWTSGTSQAVCAGGSPKCIATSGACSVVGTLGCSGGSSTGCNAPGWWSSNSSSAICVNAAPGCTAGSLQCTSGVGCVRTGGSNGGTCNMTPPAGCYYYLSGASYSCTTGSGYSCSGGTQGLSCGTTSCSTTCSSPDWWASSCSCTASVTPTGFNPSCTSGGSLTCPAPNCSGVSYTCSNCTGNISCSSGSVGCSNGGTSPGCSSGSLTCTAGNPTCSCNATCNAGSPTCSGTSAGCAPGTANCGATGWTMSCTNGGSNPRCTGGGVSCTSGTPECTCNAGCSAGSPTCSGTSTACGNGTGNCGGTGWVLGCTNGGSNPRCVGGSVSCSSGVAACTCTAACNPGSAGCDANGNLICTNGSPNCGSTGWTLGCTGGGSNPQCAGGGVSCSNAATPNCTPTCSQGGPSCDSSGKPTCSGASSYSCNGGGTPSCTNGGYLYCNGNVTCSAGSASCAPSCSPTNPAPTCSGPGCTPSCIAVTHTCPKSTGCPLSAATCPACGTSGWCCCSGSFGCGPGPCNGGNGCGTCLTTNGDIFNTNAWAAVSSISVNATAVPWINNRNKCYNDLWSGSNNPATEPSCIDFRIIDPQDFGQASCPGPATVYTAYVSSVALPNVGACALSCPFFGTDICKSIGQAIVNAMQGTIQTMLQNTLNNTIGSLLKNMTQLPMDMIKSLFGCACQNPNNCTVGELQTCAFHFSSSFWDTGLYPSICYDNGGLTAQVAFKANPLTGNSSFPWTSCANPSTPPPTYYNAPLLTWPTTTPNSQSYMVGLGISHDFLANLAYTLYLSGTLCMNFSADPAYPAGTTNNMYPSLNGFLNVNNFAKLMPGLRAAADPNSYVQVRLTPIGTPDVHLGYDPVAPAPPGPDNYRAAPTMTIGVTKYTLSLDFPDWQADFWIKQGGVYKNALSIKWPLVLGVSLAWNTNKNGFDFLLDVSHTDWGTGNPYPVGTTFYFGQPGTITYASTVLTSAQAAHGVGDILPMIMSSAIQSTSFFSSNLTALFGMGVSLPYANVDPVNLDPNGHAGYDYIWMFLNVTGSLNFATLFKLFGSFGNGAPPEQAPAVSLDAPPPTRGQSEVSLSALAAMQDGSAASPLYASPDVGPFQIEASDEKYGAGELQYRWKLDGGTWHTPVHDPELSFHNLLEGKHVLEVTAVNPDHWVSATPARVAFDVDSVPPDLWFQGQGVQGAAPLAGQAAGPQKAVLQGSDASIYVYAWDWQTPPESILIAHRLDDEPWTGYGTQRSVLLHGLTPGEHLLQVRGVDRAGNETLARLPITVAPPATSPTGIKALIDRTFGCSCATVGPGGSLLEGLGNLLPFLFLGFLVVVRRRRSF